MTALSSGRVPFTVLGGYLGAGKTTLVNRVLAGAQGRRLVVLVNDVGAINVDSALIADHDGETLTLTNGCVCCAIADDFGQTLERVRTRPEPPDHILMELSGVGEPRRLAPWANTTGFQLDGIVVVADADQIVDLVERRFVGDTIREQLRSADLILLAKTDLAPDGGAAARELITSLSTAPMLDTSDVVNDAAMADLVLGTGGRSDHGPATGAAPPAGDHHVARLVDVSGLTLAELERALANIGPEVIRAKGLIRCVDTPDVVEVHLVGSRRSIRRRPDLGNPATTDQIVTIAAPITP